MKHLFILALCCVPVLSCAAKRPSQAENLSAGENVLALHEGVLAAQDPALQGREELTEALDSLAETERSSGFRTGMGLAESGLREEAGDYAGAVIAAFKELLYAYGYGVLRAEQLRSGLEAVLSSRGGSGGFEEAALSDGRSGAEAPLAEAEARVTADVRASALAALAFFEGRWKEAAERLAVFCTGEEPDSFAQWMFLVSLLESGLLKGGPEDRRGLESRTDGPPPEDAENNVFGESRRAVLSKYSAIRARYANFPAYWYHLALVSGEGAERCVDLAPQGPYAGACRKILAENCGLQGAAAAAALRTKKEIENAVSAALAQGSAVFLEELFPLLSLEDNPFTLYALGALNAVSAAPLFRDYFTAKGRESPGRLGERLRYIAGGRL
jgi:hypothetical protein